MPSGVSTGKGGRSGDVIESVGFVCLTCLCLAAGMSFAAGMMGTSARPIRFEIDDTINPNNAPPASLARLPRIGPARAREIVSYRSQLSRRGDRGPAFGRAEDLRRVRGIGSATIEAVRPWLSFNVHAPGERGTVGRQP